MHWFIEVLLLRDLSRMETIHLHSIDFCFSKPNGMHWACFVQWVHIQQPCRISFYGPQYGMLLKDCTHAVLYTRSLKELYESSLLLLLYTNQIFVHIFF
ncbi:hypothetical protein GDO86_008737 [Hymenochirus boettgeri]|uniref:Uncharacterized protein n=1 Tax=Hymenochirus boettgeri TaxID=247094 RepID=A0A8T2J3A0_9PIPI|nr:hypothetical protein GDO86_008737 [Hymenochirus boettgeri]